MIFFNVDRTIFKRNILFVNCEKSSKQKKHKLKKKQKNSPSHENTGHSAGQIFKSENI